MTERRWNESSSAAPDAPLPSDVTPLAQTSAPGGLVTGAAPALVVGELVGRYQIRRSLGQGGMGQVYLARDLLLGRSVALKVVHPDQLERGGGERIVEEARLLAALNHPNIVQVYDAGMHRGAPYLALEYVDGAALAERSEPRSQDEALRLGRELADALAHAHRAGVLHCDLKPKNLLWGHDGRLRVVDFGLAQRLSAARLARAGTPAWMAPEQWLGQPLTDRTDLWAFAIVLLGLFGAPHPFGADGTASLGPDDAPRLPEPGVLPARVAELLVASLSRDPARRPSAETWRAALDDALLGRDAPLPADGPYRGLAPFDEAHALDFHGREAEVDAFCARLRTVTLLPIVGPSGVGKSSFLHAGVIPRLRARNTLVIALRPGAAPIETLARRLLAATSERTGDSNDESQMRELAAQLRAAPSLLAVKLAALTEGSRPVLLAIDQLEELFTHGAPAPDVRATLAMLLGAADDPREPTRVVVTVRDDFVGRLAGMRELHILQPLGQEALRQAIAAPLARTGHQFEAPSIIDDMLAELGGGATSELPLLQFACRALWDARDPARRLLLRSTYVQMGGVAGALARHADGVIAGLTAAQQGVARQLFLRLVVGNTRRFAPRAQLEAEVPSAGDVLDRLVAARLLVQRTTAEVDAVVEIIHEALLVRWDRLAGWLADSRQERRLLQELEEATLRWQRRGQRAEDTWPADELAAARRRLTALGLAPSPEVATFLAAGEARHRAARRRARTRLALTAAMAAAITTASVLLAAAFRRQQLAAEAQSQELRRAGTNLGAVELVLMPFEWTPSGEAIAVDAALLPALSWRVFAPHPDDEHRPGDELPAALVQRGAATLHGRTRSEHVELPGGSAFLRLDGRGRPGEHCAPSWIRLRDLPGYASRAAPRRLELAVPTCAASAWGEVAIEAGPFIYGGPGQPPTTIAEYVQPEATVDLPAFSIDRTELSNGQFAPFARMHRLTGYPVPDYPRTAVHKDAGAPRFPVTAIDSRTAEAFCRFLGKRLPGEHEWVKAARGGLLLAGAPNPAPRRLYPWGSQPAPCANEEGLADGYRWVAPVDSLPCGASPYGVLHLAGNVSEWISREGQTDRGNNPLRIVRGGQVDSPTALEHATTVFRNEREARHFSYAIGARCARGASP